MLWLMCSGWPAVAVSEVPVPDLAAQVTDLAGVFTAAQKASLEAKLAAFESQKGAQIAILTVATTQPEEIEPYSIKVVERWKLGRKNVDDGVLLVLAKDDRKTRIEVGYGLEGVIPDAIAKRIIEEIMIPYFRNGDYYAGINAGVDKLIGLIQGESLPPPETQPDTFARLDGNLLLLVFFVALFLGGLLRAMFGPLIGALLNGGISGVLVWFFGGGLILALIAAFLIALISMGMNGSSGRGGGYYGGGGYGGGGGFSGGGGGFSGGGGGFGGGGASGSW